ncbi:hypothetical protein HN709_02040 [Candidatus Peregrinibacteria bacterium]|jgi:bile acid:Na+ symporter, BASS family|nr:hypothetical protein [Candidatus Peregrinibacteria bacterium]MBT7736443.1 hypothetical protein [Candidatus Peregrinibacteria bacterium]
MKKFLENNFGIISAVGAVLALFIGPYLQGETWELIFKWYLIFGLVFLLLMSLLKTDLKSVLKCFQRLRSIFSLSIAKLVIAPLVILLFSFAVPAEYRVAMVLLAATPAAMATPGLLSLLKGDINMGMVVSVITNLIAPFTIPLILFYTVGADVEFDVLSMFGFLLLVVAIPFVIGYFMEEFTPKLVDKIQPNIGAIITVHIFFFNFAAVAPHAGVIWADFGLALQVLFFTIILSVIFHIIGLMVSFRAKPKMIVTSLVIMAYFNTGLAIVVANQYFDPTTVLMTVVYEFPWTMGLIPLQMIFAKKRRTNYNAPA